MNLRTYLICSGVIFGAVAFVHLLRIVNSWSLMIGSWSVPIWISWLGVLLPLILSASAFLLSGNYAHVPPPARD